MTQELVFDRYYGFTVEALDFIPNRLGRGTGEEED